MKVCLCVKDGGGGLRAALCYSGRDGTTRKHGALAGLFAEHHVDQQNVLWVCSRSGSMQPNLFLSLSLSQQPLLQLRTLGLISTHSTGS